MVSTFPIKFRKYFDALSEENPFHTKLQNISQEFRTISQVDISQFGLISSAEGDTSSDRSTH